MSSKTQSFFTIRQTPSNGIQFHCLPENLSYAASFKSLKSVSPELADAAAAYLLPFECNPSQIYCNQEDPRVLFTDIMDTISWLFDGDEGKQSPTLAIYLLGTFCFSLFEAYPVLWIFGHHDQIRFKLEELIRRLSFNGMLAGADWNRKTLLRLIKEFSPTIVFERVTIQGSHQWENLIRHPNTRQRVSSSDFSNAFPTFCPKIVIAKNLVDNLRNPYSISLRLEPSKEPFLDLSRLELLRQRILSFVSCCSHEIQKTVDEQSKTSDATKPFFPIEAIGGFLKKIGAIDEATHSQLVRYITSVSNLRFSQYDIEDEVLKVIVKSVSEKPDELIYLETLAEKISEIDTIRHFNAKQLSQFLNQRGLISKRKRQRTLDKNKNPNKNEGPKYKQRTAVRINFVQLCTLTRLPRSKKENT